MNRAIQYRKFGGPEVLEMVETDDPVPAGGEIRISARAVGLNPVDSKIFGGDPRLRLVGALRSVARPGHWFANDSSPFPRGVARDFAGRVDAVGEHVAGFAVGDAVFGTLRSAPGLGTKRGSLAQKFLAPVSDVVPKPERLGFDVAGSLGVAAQAACGALRRLDVRSGDVLVVSGASGGVGSLAVQLAVRRGATVIGIAGKSNDDVLRSWGVIPVPYGDGVRARVLTAAPGPVTKLLDCFGGEYVKLGFSLHLPGRAIGTLVPSPAVFIRGAQFTGSRHARPNDLHEVADLVAAGAITFTVAHAYPFDIESVRDAYTELNTGHARGKLVIDLS